MPHTILHVYLKFKLKWHSELYLAPLMGTKILEIHFINEKTRIQR